MMMMMMIIIIIIPRYLNVTLICVEPLLAEFVTINLETEAATKNMLGPPAQSSPFNN